MILAMSGFEKLGVFYLGKACDAAKKRRRDDLLLYDSRDLVTHAVRVGMTGSLRLPYRGGELAFG